MISYVDCHWALRRAVAHVHHRARHWHRPVGHHHHAPVLHRAAAPQAWQWVCRAVVIGGSIGGLTGAAPQGGGYGGGVLPSAYPPASYSQAPEGFPSGFGGGGGFAPAGFFGPGFGGPQASLPPVERAQMPLPLPTPAIVAPSPTGPLLVGPTPALIVSAPPVPTSIATVSEPASVVLLGFGLALVALLRGRQEARSQGDRL